MVVAGMMAISMNMMDRRQKKHEQWERNQDYKEKQLELTHDDDE